MNRRPRRRGRPPRLLVFSGLPGTGKSTLSRAVAERLGATWLRIDTVEAAIVESGVPRSFATGVAGYVGAARIARENLEIGQDVVIDAVTAEREGRRLWRDVARETRASRYVIALRLSDAALHRRRVEGRPSPTPPLPAPTWSEVVARAYRPWTEPVLTVEGSAPVEENVRQVLAYCARPPPRLEREGGGRPRRPAIAGARSGKVK